MSYIRETIKEFAAKLFQENELEEVYIAIIEYDKQWYLEVEISNGEIAGTYQTNTSDLEIARYMADDLDDELYTYGVIVHSTRKSWEEYLP